jgi:hypothetical protein
MKQGELQKCALCEKGVMHSGCPIFYRLRLQRFCVDLRAVNRRHGLELMVGSPELAAVFGTNEDIAKPLDGEETLFVCQDCLTAPSALAQLSEVNSESR